MRILRASLLVNPELAKFLDNAEYDDDGNNKLATKFVKEISPLFLRHHDVEDGYALAKEETPLPC